MTAPQDTPSCLCGSPHPGWLGEDHAECICGHNYQHHLSIYEACVGNHRCDLCDCFGFRYGRRRGERRVTPSPVTLDTINVRHTLQMIADDMAADAKAFNGQPFNGRTVGEYFGNQGAAVAAMANILRALIEDESAPPGTPETPT